MSDDKLKALIRRAKREEILAIQATDMERASFHRRLSVQYSARAVIEIISEFDPPAVKGTQTQDRNQVSPFPREIRSQDHSAPGAGNPMDA